MSTHPRDEPCPFCHRPIPIDAERCRHCGEYLYEDENDYDRPRRGQQIEATDFLVPTNVSGWSLASCYMGLIGFLLPIIGLIFAIPALIFGIIALQKRRKTGTYGAVTSDIRAVIGIILSLLGMVISAVVIFILMK